MKYKPEWEVEGRNWPNRSASQFVKADGISWHVQIMGAGPALLLIHGTGAATHSWRDLAPMLAERFQVIALDLPGHGFTEVPLRGAYALPNIAASVTALLAALKAKPDYVAGHSAGAAIALRMALDGSIRPRRTFSLNGALRPWPGMASLAFPALARVLFLNPFAAPFLAWRASSDRTVARLIEGTGSNLDAAGLDLYGRLLRTERHVGAAVALMANWDLNPLQRELAGLKIPLTLIAASRDLAVPPRDASAIATIVPSADVIHVRGYGHLAHEEAPAIFAKIIHDAVSR